MPRHILTLYTSAQCPACHEAESILQHACAGRQAVTRVVDIATNPVLHQMFADHVPVLEYDRHRLYWPFSVADVAGLLSDHQAGPVVSGRTRDVVVWVDKFVYHFSKHWLPFVIAIVGLYAGLPLLAPLLMASGHEGLANLIYSGYRFGCHQLPSRSFFIAGQQIAYCERCMATYTSLFLSAVLFVFLRHRLRSLSWQIYVLFLVPLALDGITQLAGLRASSWQLRVLTGALFGIGSAWMALPYLELGFRDARQSVNDNLRLE